MGVNYEILKDFRALAATRNARKGSPTPLKVRKVPVLLGFTSLGCHSRHRSRFITARLGNKPMIGLMIVS